MPAVSMPPGAPRRRGKDGLVARIRALERRLGIYRPGRSPWVWVLGPGLNMLGTIAVTLWVGHIGGLEWAISVPLALFCGVAMGLMAWAFIGNTWEQEEDERRAAEEWAPPGPPAAAPREDSGRAETR